MRVKTLAYEDCVPSQMGKSAQRVVGDFMRRSSQADLVVCILCNRMGTPTVDEATGRSYESGTHYELDSAYRQYQDSGLRAPRLLLFLGNRPLVSEPSDAEFEQYARARSFRKQLKNSSKYEGLYFEYSDSGKFEELVRSHLRQHLDDLLAGSQRSGEYGRPGGLGLRLYFDHLIRDHTDLFCGRSEEINSIQEFLEKARGGYVFIEGLSGYGKTSLLARLVCDNPDFAYHFISQTYKTAGSAFDPTELEPLLLNLCEQLKAGPVVGDKARLGVEFMHLLRNPPAEGRRVVVIDAIDEVDRNPNYLLGLLPVRLSDGVFVILSARSQGDRSYLTSVGLNPETVGLHIRLKGLDEATVEELLVQAGGQAGIVARQPGFAKTLHDLSGGDPFYLRFLVADVKAGSITRANLARIPNGLGAYLDRQLSQLSRSAHMPQQRDILGYLLKARSPLSRADLIKLVPGLDGMNFNDVMSDIHRFLLLRDGTYTFCHDRFKTYFATALG